MRFFGMVSLECKRMISLISNYMHWVSHSIHGIEYLRRQRDSVAPFGYGGVCFRVRASGQKLGSIIVLLSLTPPPSSLLFFANNGDFVIGAVSQLITMPLSLRLRHHATYCNVSLYGIVLNLIGRYQVRSTSLSAAALQS
jgi:hypothetical protein